MSRQIAEVRIDPTLREVIGMPGFCAKRLRCDPLRHNDWIRPA
ncbi:MAG TPA: hypothetical protein VFS11_10010 [Gemmatimonadales bacterium]|nr:hypothetical protein [Gemmatimonadales bacterium]